MSEPILDYFFYHQLPPPEVTDLSQEVKNIRAHHAPMAVYDFFLSMLASDIPTMSDIITAGKVREEIIRENVPVRALWDRKLRSYSNARLAHYQFNVNYREHDVTDYVNLDNNPENDINALVNAEVESYRYIVVGDPEELVAIGSVTDIVCNACFIGKHCKLNAEMDNGDDRIARRIAHSNLQLDRPVWAVESPIMTVQQQDNSKSKNSLKPAPLAVVTLGDLREFLIRRALQAKGRIEPHQLPPELYDLPETTRETEHQLQAQIETARQKLSTTQ